MIAEQGREEGELVGRVAIVTGSGRGIGKGVASVLAREGACIVVNDLDIDICQAVTDEIKINGGKAIAAPADVANWTSVMKLLELTLSSFAKVDILVNNAGILRSTSPLEDISEDEWDLVMNVNVKGVFNCTKAVLPYMKKQKRGKIVNVSSIAGRSTSNSGGAHYTTSKAALLGLTRHAAREAAPFGINVNAIAPAGVDTEMVPQVWSQKQIDALLERIPIHRLATTEEIGELVLFLVSDRSLYITGATIDINGGIFMV